MRSDSVERTNAPMVARGGSSGLPQLYVSVKELGGYWIGAR
jgi:hypothetical protein